MLTNCDDPGNLKLRIIEAGILRGDFGTYTTGDKLRVAVEGGVVKYRRNGTLLYTSSVAPTYPLLVDAALYSTASTLSNVVLSSGGGQTIVNHSFIDPGPPESSAHDSVDDAAKPQRNDSHYEGGD